MALDFYSIFYQLESAGFYEYVLPFLLVFIVIFAALDKTKILGTVKGKDGETIPKTNLNILLALIFSFTILVNTDLIFLMNQYLSKMSFFIVIAVAFMLVLALFNKPSEGKGFFGSGSMIIATIIAIGAVIWSLYSSTYGNIFPYGIYISDSTLSFIFFFVIIALVIALIKPRH
jgi:hypothetical protein